MGIVIQEHGQKSDGRTIHQDKILAGQSISQTGDFSPSDFFDCGSLWRRKEAPG
jgi:hypothetical protein